MDFALLATAELADALELCKQYGPMLVVVIFFLWRDYKREDRLTSRIDMLEDEMRKVILPLVTDCSEVITRNTAVMERLEHHLKHQR